MSSATPTDPDPEPEPGSEDALVLRQAVDEDLPGIAELYLTVRAAAVPLMPPIVRTADEVHGYVRGWDLAARDVWVAEEAGALVAFACVTSTWLDSLYVHPHAQGRGIGTALLELAMALRPGGLGLWVFESNTPARALYARHGFAEVERTDGSGNEERAPDIRMEWPGAAGSR